MTVQAVNNNNYNKLSSLLLQVIYIRHSMSLSNCNNPTHSSLLIKKKLKKNIVIKKIVFILFHKHKIHIIRNIIADILKSILSKP